MATDVAIIVPVIERPDAAERFMETAAGQGNVYAISHDGDQETADAWHDAGATVLIGRSPRYAPKVNLAYRGTFEPFMFFVGDDVRFQDGAMRRAVEYADSEELSMVSVSDGHSEPYRMAGIAPHPLVRRHYITRFGMSWDGPGTVAHEGYFHQCVDLEWSFIARQRFEFGYCEEAVVEHLHPAFGKGLNDPIYDLGSFHWKADHIKFIDRVMTFGVHDA